MSFVRRISFIICPISINRRPTIFCIVFWRCLERIALPMQWTIANFDLCLDADTAPPEFLIWMLGWYGIAVDETWDTACARTLLAEAPGIYARNGTAWALTRLLEIYVNGKAGDVSIREQRR